MIKSLKPYTQKTLVEQFAAKLSKPVDKDFVANLTQHQYSKSTCLSIASDWNHFITFCTSGGHCALPASPDTITLFIESQSRFRRYNTLKRYTVSIGIIHYLLFAKRPTNTKDVKLCLLKYTNTDAHAPTQIHPTNEKQLAKAGTVLKPHEDIKDLRDLCIANIMFDAALKRKELVQLDTKDIVESEQGLTVYVKDHTYVLSATSSNLLKKWLEHCPTPDTPLFRAINKGKNISETRIDESSVYRAIRRISAALKLPKHAQLSGQSGRVGAVKALRKQGFGTTDIKIFGRYSSPVMVLQYIGDTERANIEIAKHRDSAPWD